MASQAIPLVRVDVARVEIRNVERFAMRSLSEAKNPQEETEAKTLLRLAVGLRRKLDVFQRS